MAEDGGLDGGILGALGIERRYGEGVCSEVRSKRIDGEVDEGEGGGGGEEGEEEDWEDEVGALGREFDGLA